MPNKEPTIEDILNEMLTEYEIFVNNSAQLIKEAKAALKKQKRGKK